MVNNGTTFSYVLGAQHDKVMHECQWKIRQKWRGNETLSESTVLLEELKSMMKSENTWDTP